MGVDGLLHKIPPKKNGGISVSSSGWVDRFSLPLSPMTSLMLDCREMASVGGPCRCFQSCRKKCPLLLLSLNKALIKPLFLGGGYVDRGGRLTGHDSIQESEN